MRAKDWTAHRLAEPSTHSAIAVLIVAGAFYLNSLTVEGLAGLPWFLGWATVHAALGLVLKEGKGLV